MSTFSINSTLSYPTFKKLEHDDQSNNRALRATASVVALASAYYCFSQSDTYPLMNAATSVMLGVSCMLLGSCLRTNKPIDVKPYHYDPEQPEIDLDKWIRDIIKNGHNNPVVINPNDLWGIAQY